MPALSELESRTAIELFEAAPCGYLFTQPDGTITRANQTFLQWTGYSSDDLVGRKRFQELLTTPASIFYETHFSPLLQMQGYVREITIDLVCADGRTLPALVNSAIQKDDAGRPAFIRTMVFDIRERRRYERELLAERRKAEQLADVVEVASDAIVRVTEDMAVTSWNRAAENLFAYTVAEAMGRDLRELIFCDEFRQNFEQQLARLQAGDPWSLETLVHDKSGASIAVSATLNPHLEPPNEFLGFSAIIRDIRDRLRAEESRQAEQNLKLVNRLAHEINNPLQVSVNCLTILSQQADSAYIRLAEEHLQRVAQAVTDLANLTTVDKR